MFWVPHVRRPNNFIAYAHYREVRFARMGFNNHLPVNLIDASMELSHCLADARSIQQDAVPDIVARDGMGLYVKVPFQINIIHKRKNDVDNFRGQVWKTTHYTLQGRG
jgi:hypothetical protein